MPCPALPEGFDFTDPDLLQHRVPFPEFAQLRQTEPIRWIAQPTGISGFGDSGYWAVTRHADVKYVSTRPELFSSNLNTAVIRFNESISRDQIEVQKLIMLNMDPPEHTRVRQIVQRGFTPRAIRSLEDALRNRAGSIVETALANAAPDGSFDFVTNVAVELPLQAIAELIGVPQDDRTKIFDWSNKMAAYDDPEYAITEEVGAEAAMEIVSYAMNLAAARKECPAKDIVSQLVAAEDEGNLSSDEFGFFVILLAVAGNETTRNAITHGMHAFLTNPDQWELFKRERPETTAEEIVRWATPWSPSSAPRPRTPSSAAPRSRRATGSASSTRRPTTTPRSSTAPTSSTSPATRIRTSDSAAEARTSASASRWPRSRSTSSSTPWPTPCPICA